MSKLLRLLQLIVCLLLLPCSFAMAEGRSYQSIPVFCYHDVVTPDRTDVLEKDPYAISTKRLEEHFKLYRKLGYTPISMKQYSDYVEGNGELPEKPIMITFDDGRDSMYYNIYPLLKKYQVPAVYAIILSYMETMPSDIENMVTWEQLNEMAASGLVHIGNHSYSLHNFVVANSYGDRYQNVSTIWWNEDNVYEDEKEFEKRILDDMERSSKILKENLHYHVNTMVWPYGVFTEFSKMAAKKYGYKYQLLLNDDVKNDDTDLLSRYIIVGNPTDKELKMFLEHRHEKNKLVAGQIDIDAIYDPLPEQFERNIDAVADKLWSQNMNTVFLQAFSDKDGDGNVDAVYFHTDQLPIEHDVFSHVTMRLKAKGFKVFAWMPILSYSYMTEDSENVITASEDAKSGWYRRATPFSVEVRKNAHELVKDLVLYAPIDGILFQDDLYMNDFEDFSSYGKAYFKKNFNKELSMEALQDKDLQHHWTRLKTKFINDFTAELIQTAKIYRPELKTARNIYSIVITNPEAETWFAQNYDDFLQLYDYVVIMAYPEMEGVEDDERWLEELVTASVASSLGKEKAVFKLQGYDWSIGKWINAQKQERRSKCIRRAGGVHFAQYPINVFEN